MPLGNNESTLLSELNRLANGGVYPEVNLYDEAGAARAWAERTDIPLTTTDTVGVLNEIAGLPRNSWLDYSGVCNYIAGTTGLPAAAALRQVAGEVQTPTPSQPLLIVANAGNQSVQLNWAPPANSGDAPVDGYRVSVQFHPEMGYIETVAPGATVSGLTNGETYFFLIEAHNAFGWGATAISPGATPFFADYPATVTNPSWTLNPAGGYQIQYLIIDGVVINAGVPFPDMPNSKVIQTCWPDICETHDWAWTKNWEGSQLVYTPGAATCPNGGYLNPTTNICQENPPPPVYNLGDVGPAGGIIFIVPASQGGLGGDKYYEGWTSDLGGTAWSSDTSTLVGASGSAIGTGITNTALIPGGASALCQTPRGGFSDWFFPSTDEMTQLFNWIPTSGNQNYWTSTEANASQAITRDLAAYGRDPYPYSKGAGFNVRPVRSF